MKYSIKHIHLEKFCTERKYIFPSALEHDTAGPHPSGTQQRVCFAPNERTQELLPGLALVLTCALPLGVRRHVGPGRRSWILK